MNDLFLLHYTEIGTKGKNRSYFERRLRDDIQKRLSPQHLTNVRISDCRIVADMTPQADRAVIRAALSQVFGVAWFAFAKLVSREWADIEAAGLFFAGEARGAKTFKVYSNRVDKSYPLSSQEICNRLGKAVEQKFGLKVDLDEHDLGIHVEIIPELTCVYGERHPGMRGLPRGSSGRMLCLFSGGIDSPVAAWMLMRRGALVHLLHFHPFRRAEDLRDTKIIKLHKTLRTFNPTSRLFLIPHYHYQVKAALEIPTEYEMVLFRRFMFRAAEELARRRRMKALITGDALGQVASQTVENIAAAQADLGLPMFLPLIAMDKEEIVRCAQKIGTYEDSILPYKDCCSLMSRHPKTMVSVERVREMESKLNFPELIRSSLDAIEVWDGETFTPFAKTAAPQTAPTA